MTSYREAVASPKRRDNERFHYLVAEYKSSDDYKRLSDSTRRNWGPWLDRIRDEFGDLHIAQFGRPDKIRPIIRNWRSQWSDTKRTADYGLQVLSRVLSYAVDPLGAIGSNPCIGIKYLYKNNRSDIIWRDDQIAHIKKHTSVEVGWVIDLASHTGLRLGDLVALEWKHIYDDRIEVHTSKGKKHRLIALIPMYSALRALLATIVRRADTVLTNTRGQPWSANGFGTSMDDAKIAAKMKPDPKDKDDTTTEIDLHFHDLRGTAATKFYIAHVPIRSIAEIMAWTSAALNVSSGVMSSVAQ